MLLRHLPTQQMQVAAPAKINLYLELLQKRDDGFHEIETVMSTVSIFDQLLFTPNDSGQFTIEVRPTDDDAEPIPTDGGNLLHRSLELLREISGNRTCGGDRLGMDVKLLKRIPSSAGLGGASSNAAAALVAGNRLWGLGLNRDQLIQAAGKIGSDVPFFLIGGTAMCRGRGEVIEPVTVATGLNFVIAKPRVGLSTPLVYQRCDLSSSRHQSEGMVDSIATGHAAGIGDAMFNRMQQAASKITDEVPRLAQAFGRLPCLGHQMSGSGSSYFGLFGNLKIARNAAARLAARWPELEIHCVKSLNNCSVLTA